MDLERKSSLLSQLLEHHDEIVKILEEGDNAKLVDLCCAKAIENVKLEF